MSKVTCTRKIGLFSLVASALGGIVFLPTPFVFGDDIGSLKTVSVPLPQDPQDLRRFVKNSDAALALGKSLFWDTTTACWAVWPRSRRVRIPAIPDTHSGRSRTPFRTIPDTIPGIPDSFRMNDAGLVVGSNSCNGFGSTK